MNMARQISRRFGRATGMQTRFAVDYSITATILVVPDPLGPVVENGKDKTNVGY